MSSHLLLSQPSVRTCGLTSGARPRVQPLRLQHIHRQTAQARLPQRVQHITKATTAQDSSSSQSGNRKQQQPARPGVAPNSRPATDPEILDAEEELDFEEVYTDHDGESELDGEEGVEGFEQSMLEDRIPITVGVTLTLFVAPSDNPVKTAAVLLFGDTDAARCSSRQMVSACCCAVF